MAPVDVVYRSTIHGQLAEISVVEEKTSTYRLTVDGVPQSQVSLSDPTLVDFEYARHIARLIDAQAPAGGPLRCAHLGGGALTLPRYVQATRPGSVQYVVESEVERTADLLGILPLAAGSDMRFVFGDARAVVDGGRAPRDGSTAGSTAGNAGSGTVPAPWTDADVTVVDLWAGSTIAARVASLEFYSRLAALSAPGGLLAVNLIDGPGFWYARRQAATLRTLFEHVAVAADPSMFTESLVGNVLVFASDRPLTPLAEPGWPAGDADPPRVLRGAELGDWIAGAPPMTDDDATDSPPPDSEFITYDADEEQEARDLADGDRD